MARYGESCDNDSGCERPFICHKKGLLTPGMCRCPLKYDFVKDQCGQYDFDLFNFEYVSNISG